MYFHTSDFFMPQKNGNWPTSLSRTFNQTHKKGLNPTPRANTRWAAPFFPHPITKRSTIQIMKNIRALAAFALAVLSFSAFGQSYKTAAGIRVENGFNLTAQQYITKGWTAEGILHTPLVGSSRDLGLTLLAEKHHKLIGRGTNFYTGAGAHYYWQSNANREIGEVRNNVFGLSAIAGVEVSLGRLNLAVDWKPELHLAGDQVRPLEWNGAAISARYIIEKRERRKIKDWKVWDRFGGNKHKKNDRNKRKR
jgi:hypothetical protein